MKTCGGLGSALKADLLQALEKIKPLKAVVVGDDIMDVYIQASGVGYANKTMAPVYRRERALAQHAGGSRAVARHMDAFCDNVKLYMPPRIVYKERYVKNTNKREVLFQILDQPDITVSERDKFLTSAEEAARQADVVVCMDFGHGAFIGGWVIPGEAVKFVNCQSNSWSRGFSNIAALEWINENGPMWLFVDENEMRSIVGSRDAEPEDMYPIHGKTIVTRGHRGLWHPANDGFTVPAFKVPEVDRTGAGDAALAVAALLTAANAGPEVVAHGAAIAGALKAQIWGNERGITRQEFIQFVESA